MSMYTDEVQRMKQLFEGYCVQKSINQVNVKHSCINPGMHEWRTALSAPNHA